MQKYPLTPFFKASLFAYLDGRAAPVGSFARFPAKTASGSACAFAVLDDALEIIGQRCLVRPASLNERLPKGDGTNGGPPARCSCQSGRSYRPYRCRSYL